MRFLCKKPKLMFTFALVFITIIIGQVFYLHHQHYASNRIILEYYKSFIQEEKANTANNHIDKPLIALFNDERTTNISRICSTDVDPAFQHVSDAMKVLEIVTKQNNAFWFVWGEAALSLLASGTFSFEIYLNAKALVDTNQQQRSGPLRHNPFYVYIAAQQLEDVQHVWRDLAIVTANLSILLKCPINNPEGSTGGCSEIISSKKNDRLSGEFRLTILGPAIIDYGEGELLITMSDLHVKHAIKLANILPLGYASYYGIKVPIPNDPIFVYSHVVPIKGTAASADLRYQFGQGCSDLLRHSAVFVQNLTPSNNTADDHLTMIKTCGQTLYQKGFQTFYNVCHVIQVNISFVPFSDILKANTNEHVLYFEDWAQVLVLNHGSGKYNLDNRHGTVKSPISWSQYGQDRFVDGILKHKRNGFFVEIGGYDGEHFSNTLFFEKQQNWTGLLVEPNPYSYAMMVGRDRKCHMLNACITNTSEIPFVEFSLAGGMTSGKGFLTDWHRKRMDNVINSLAKGKTIDKRWIHSRENVKVYCKSLLTVLDKIGTRYIDYFSLDVEGAELSVLNSIQWDLIDIDVFTIETDQHRDEILEFMKEHGYRWIKKHAVDDVFQKI